MNLTTALLRALPFCGKSSTLPILEHVLVAGDRVVAGDLTSEIAVTLDAPAGIEAALPAGKLAPILGLMDGADVRQEKSQVIFQRGRSRWKIATLPAQDYPRIAPTGEPITYFAMPARELRERLSTALHAAAVGDVRYYLNGVRIERSDNELAIVATDGYRLIMQTLPLVGADFGAILPREAIGHIVKALAEEEEVEAAVHETAIVFASESQRVTVKLVDGKYPNWRRVMTEPPLVAIVEAAPFAAALKRAARYADEEFHGVQLVIDGGEIAIEANDGDNQAAEVLAAETREKLSIGVNVKYLLDAIETAGAEQVAIYATDEQSSMRVEPHPAREGYAHVVMPMRV